MTHTWAKGHGGGIIGASGLLTVSHVAVPRVAYLSQPCRADFNYDGILEYFDYFEFSYAFDTWPPSVEDITHSWII
jgi:hypothetical protein